MRFPSKTSRYLLGVFAVLLCTPSLFAQDEAAAPPLGGSYTLEKNGNEVVVDLQNPDGTTTTYELGTDIVVPLLPLGPYTRAWIRPVGGGAKIFLEPPQTSVTYFYPLFPGLGIWTFTTHFGDQRFHGTLGWNADAGHWTGVVAENGNVWTYKPE